MTKFAGLPEKKKKKKKPNLRQQEAEFLVHHGVQAYQMGDLPTALHYYMQAHEIMPTEPQIVHNIAASFSALGQSEQADLFWQKLCELNPKASDAWLQLGISAANANQLIEAAVRFRKVLALEPKQPSALCFLAGVEELLEHDDSALDALQKLLQSKFPASLEDNISAILGRLVSRMDRDARPATERAGLQNVVKAALKKMTQPELLVRHICTEKNNKNLPEESFALTQLAVQEHPASIVLNQINAFTSNFVPELSAVETYAIHRQTAQVIEHQYPLQKQAWSNTSDPDRPLRIGYVSKDFGFHVIAHFIDPLFNMHHRDAVEVFAYSLTNQKDAVNQKLRGEVDHWRDIHDLPPREIRQQILQDQIDILVDLMGYSSSPCLEIFTMRSAPLQMTWLGYLNTTGLTQMDYRITDSIADPVTTSALFHSEKLACLPDAQWGYVPPIRAEIQLKPMDSPIVFGSCNHFSKVNHQVLRHWLSLLHAVENSQLVILGVTSDWTESYIRRYFAEQGIVPERLQLHQSLNIDEYFAVFNQIDIGLDAWPYSGGTTTCNALWMGVPVITFPGERSFSRSATSILYAVEATELIATNADDYVTKALELARDVPRCRAYKQHLRQQLEASPLMDMAHFVLHLEQLYRQAWRRWCQQLPPEHFLVGNHE